MANIETVVLPEYAVPISAPQIPVGGVLDPNTNNAQVQTVDVSVGEKLDRLIVLMDSVLTELQMLNENLFPGVNLDSDRQGRYIDASDAS